MEEFNKNWESALQNAPIVISSSPGKSTYVLFGEYLMDTVTPEIITKINTTNFESIFAIGIDSDNFKRQYGARPAKHAKDSLPIINKIFQENQIFNMFNVTFADWAKINETKHNIVSEIYLKNEELLLPILVESNMYKLLKSIFTHTTNKTNTHPDRIKKLDIYQFIEQASTNKNKTFITSYINYKEIKNIFEKDLVNMANKIIKLIYEKTPTNPTLQLKPEVYLFNQIIPKLIKIKNVEIAEDVEISNIVTNKLTLSLDDNPNNNIIIYAINAPTSTVNTIEANGDLKISQTFTSYYFDELVSTGYSANIGETSGYLIDTVDAGIQAYNINELLGILEAL